MSGSADAIRTVQSVADVSQTVRARSILHYAHDSAVALLAAFESVRRERGAGRGRSTDEEQDLLRSMLVISAAGLDALLKQLLRDCLPDLARTQESACDELEKYVRRQLRGEQQDDAEAATSGNFLAKLLIAESLRDELLHQYTLHLTGISLQSAQELAKACNAMAIDPRGVGVEVNSLKPIFDVRNRIIHELDIDFDTGIRNRFPRSRQSMIDYSNKLLEVGENIITAVEAKLGLA